MLTNTLQVNQLHCIRQEKPLFVDMSWQLQAGEALLVTGENGSGKSSLLRLLTGLATPAMGDIHWCGMPIQQIRTEYAEQLHYVGHANGVKLGLTVKENLELAILLCRSESLPCSPEPLFCHPERSEGSHTSRKKILRCAQDDKIKAQEDRVNAQEDRKKAQEDILNKLNLYPYLNTLTKYLSAGQKRRLALAKLFLIAKPLWIIDEPFTALDSAMQALFLTQLQHHLNRGGIAVVSSHHPIDLAGCAIKELRLSTC